MTAFVVPGDPITWKRAGRGGGRTFTKPKDRSHRDRIIAFARNAGLRRPLTCPVELHLRFYFSRGADVTSLCVGDLDNLEKSVKDALKGVAFLDDRLVTDVVKRKRIDRENPRTEIEISEAVLT